MKYRSSLLLLLLILILSPGCKKEPTYHLNQEFTIQLNKTVRVQAGNESITIRFTHLVDETRCQPNTQCAWAGEVAVQIEADISDYIIGFHSDYPSTKIHNGRTITLLDVDYGAAKNYGKEKKYSVKLKVE
nr:hypothetical protein [uncultured Fluviicola sp.]